MFVIQTAFLSMPFLCNGRCFSAIVHGTMQNQCSCSMPGVAFNGRYTVLCSEVRDEHSDKLTRSLVSTGLTSTTMDSLGYGIGEHATAH